VLDAINRVSTKNTFSPNYFALGMYKNYLY